MIRSLIERRSPEFVDNFIFETASDESGRNIFSYEPCESKVLIKGDSAISMAVAYFRFMRDCCSAYFTVDHALAYGEFSLPSKKCEGVIESKYRTCLEYTSFSCAACWWNWERWENEIDFMAMNGINMPLAVVGTQAVWLKTMDDLGMKEALSLSGLSGPSFWGWQLSNCFDGYLPQAKRSSVETQIDLGRKIIEREKELGMEPIMQGFSGYIFRNFIQGKVRARMNKSDEWCLFPRQYQLSVRDLMFHKIGNMFYKNQSLLLGSSKYYVADPFIAHAPTKSGGGFLAGLGTAIFKLISAQGEDCVWVMNSSTVKREIIKALPKEKILIIDGGELCNKKELDGVGFILSTRYNNGDVTAIHGDIDGVSANRLSGFNAENPNVCGVASVSDGAYSNEIFRQYSFAAISGEKDAEKWFETFAANRYGTDSKAASEAFALLKKSCWRSGQPAREHASAICTRPATLLRHTSIGDSGSEIGYDIADVFAAAQKLIEAQGKTYEYELDLCDVLRQALSDLANRVCKKALEGYKNKDVAAFEENTNLFLEIIEDLDRLLLTKKEFSLPYHLTLARNLGSDDTEKQNYEINLLSQITIFGPVKDTVLYDTCWKEWGGMVSTFYALRWRAFFEQLAAGFKKLRRIPEKTRQQVFDRDTYLGSEFGGSLSRIEKEWIATYTPDYESVGKEDTVSVARELVSKYAPNF